MELELISKGKNSLEFFVVGERHTLSNLLKSWIEKDSAVEFSAYTLDHPLGNKAKFIVKTSGRKSPEKVVEDACEAVEKELKEFSEKIRKLK